VSFYVSTATFFLLHCDEWDRVVALSRHKFVTGATLLQLGGNHRSVASHWQTLSHNVVSGTPRHGNKTIEIGHLRSPRFGNELIITKHCFHRSRKIDKLIYYKYICLNRCNIALISLVLINLYIVIIRFYQTKLILSCKR
jgi:hypothetical protein